jgi:predicted phosphodiesterase
MERSRSRSNKIPTTILTSDWHLREDTPICYIGDYWKDQWDTVDFISDLQKKYNCPVWHAGDLFDKWKPSPMLLSEASKHIPNNLIVVSGQHDLPQHNLELIYKSGIYNLMINGKLSILQNGHWGQSLGDGRTGFIIKGKQATLQHLLVYQKKPFPGVSGGFAAGILRKYPQYDLICCGDNHQSFVEEYEGRLLVNPGSMMRMDADQINFKPSIYLWFAEDNTVQRIYLPIVEGVISREHLDIKEQRNERIDAFVSKLNDEYQAEMSFEENLESFFNINNVREPIKEIIYKSLENGKT